MIRVTFDSSQLEKQYGKLAEKVLQASIDSLAAMGRDIIREKVGASLSIKTAQAYLNAVKVDRQHLATTISIDNPKMEKLEAGITPFDIKDGLLRSPKAKRSKSGEPYIDVPFSHRTHKRAPGKGAAIPAGNMRKAVLDAMAKLGKEGDPTASTRMFVSRGGRGQKIQADMKVTSESAQTFRRVSKKSAPESWQHPGRGGLGAFTAAASAIEANKDKVVEFVAKEMGL